MRPGQEHAGEIPARLTGERILVKRANVIAPTPRFRQRAVAIFHGLAAASLLLALANPRAVVAGEGGGSHYMPGTMGDFAMALIGPPGFYLRNDLLYFQGDIDAVTLGDRIYSSASQDVWVNTLKLIYLAGSGILGGRLGGALTIPIVLDAQASGTLVSPLQGSPSGNRSGIADITVSGLLNWAFGHSHVSAGLNVYVPVGAYDEDRIINLGRNYWSFDPVGTFTWLHPERGHEVSFTTGFMFNTQNGATDYSSGTEWHFDFMLSQHFSKRFAVGLEGSVLQGISDDSGPLLDRANTVLPAIGLKPLEGFRAQYFALGPAVLVTPPVFGKDVNLIAKYLVDIDHKNRFNSDYLMISLALKF